MVRWFGSSWLRHSLVIIGFTVTVTHVPLANAAQQSTRSTVKASTKSSSNAAQIKSSRQVRAVNGKRSTVVKAAPARPTLGQLYGLHATDDPLDLKSSVALVIDQDTQQVLFSKNPQAVLPIASITKLMTALVVTDSW